MEPNAHRSKILLVDDDERNLRLLKGILFTESYEILTATDGYEALDSVHTPGMGGGRGRTPSTDRRCQD
jgi:CheY-like chemotaxis protein